MGTAVLLRTLQSYEPHAVYWVWHVPPGGHDRRVAYHPQHDCGCYLLCHVCGPRHGANPISGLVATAVPGEGEWRRRAVDSCVVLVSFQENSTDKAGCLVTLMLKNKLFLVLNITHVCIATSLC